jgi:plasmid stabilization system protein ParE
MNIRYEKRALEDLESIHSYISKFDQQAAKRVIARIEHVIGLIFHGLARRA